MRQHQIYLGLTLTIVVCNAQMEIRDSEMRNTCGNTTSMTTSSSSTRVDRWINEPKFRGTFDIIWTSMVTIFISTYSMLCLNVPAPNDTFLRRFGRHVLWMCLGILGPEFPLTYAAGQWSRAKHSVDAFREAGYDDWHMTQAFFADMGGFVFHTRDGTSFPLNAKQLHWLVTNRFVGYPKVSRKAIEDKSKRDSFTKAIAAIQVGYLVIHCTARAVQGLAITIIELNALAIVVCSLMTSGVWWYKPADVQSPIDIYSACSLAEITSARPWNLTPLDFVDENGPGYSVNVQPFMRMPVIPPQRPIGMIPNDRFPTDPYGVQEYFLCFATLVFTAVHVAGWNFDFPTSIERFLWRVCSLLLFGITVAFWIFETAASWTRLGRWKTVYLYVLNRKALEAHLNPMNQRTPTMGRKSKELPLPWEFATISPLGIVYGLARFFMIAEAFAELRNIERTAFVNVDWTYFLPHA